MAAFAATVSAKDVLPTPGRAAKIIKSEFWRPFVSSSSSVMPVGTPVMPSLRLFKRSKRGATKLSIDFKVLRTWLSAIAKISRSASCSTLSGVDAGSIDLRMISEDVRMSLRSTALLRKCSNCHGTFAEDATDSINSKMYSRPPTMSSLPIFVSSAESVTGSMGVTALFKLQRAFQTS